MDVESSIIEIGSKNAKTGTHVSITDRHLKNWREGLQMEIAKMGVEAGAQD